MDPATRYEVTATPGWTPVAIPGRPGWWRHCLSDGRQLDLPSRDLPNSSEGHNGDR